MTEATSFLGKENSTKIVVSSSSCLGKATSMKLVPEKSRTGLASDNGIVSDSTLWARNSVFATLQKPTERSHLAKVWIYQPWPATCTKRSP